MRESVYGKDCGVGSPEKESKDCRGRDGEGMYERFCQFIESLFWIVDSDALRRLPEGT